MAGAIEDYSDECWAFALRIYHVPEVAPACLRLQSLAGVDVMFMLAVIFAATQKNIVLTSSDVRELDEICGHWRERVVAPLRAVRTALKSDNPLSISKQASALRESIKVNELRSERIQNDLIASILQPRERISPRISAAQLAECLVTTIAHFKRSADADVSAEIIILQRVALSLM